MIEIRKEKILLCCLMISVAVHAALMFVPIWLVSSIFPTKPIAKAFLSKQTELNPDLVCVEISILEEKSEDKSKATRLSKIEHSSQSQEQAFESKIEQNEDQGFQGLVSDLESKPSQSAGYETKDDLYVPPIPSYLALPDLAGLIKDSLVVEIQILVGIDGDPIKIAFSDTLMDQQIKNSITSAVARSRFEPARLGGVPLQSWLHLPIVFRSSAQ